MSSYGLIIMILGFYVGGGTAAIHRLHSGDAGWNPWVRVPLEAIFFIQYFFNAHYNSEGDKHWTSRYQAIDEL